MRRIMPSRLKSARSGAPATPRSCGSPILRSTKSGRENDEQRSHEHRSDNRSQRRPRDPAARLRRLPDPPGGHRRGGERRARRSATGTSTPPRCTATSEGVGEAIRASGLDRADVFITSKLNNGFHRPDDARRAFDADARASLATDYVDLFLIHWPLADALRRRLRLDLEDARGVPPGRPRALDRRLELPGRAPRAARRRVRRRAGGQPDRAAPVLRQRRGRTPTAGRTASRPRRGRRSRRARCSTTR